MLISIDTIENEVYQRCKQADEAFQWDRADVSEVLWDGPGHIDVGEESFDERDISWLVNACLQEAMDERGMGDQYCDSL